MASLSQIETNRQNALRSTGPKTEAGKRLSRCRAVRHGLTAETVIVGLEDAEDSKGFRTLGNCRIRRANCGRMRTVLRLASLLWRLRRAADIVTGLLQIQSEILREDGQAQGATAAP